MDIPFFSETIAEKYHSLHIEKFEITDFIDHIQL